MYPNLSYAGYQTNTVGVWNQTSVSQNSQGMGYALPFVHPEMASYVEKAPFVGAYPALSFGAYEGDFYQRHYANINSQPMQWTQSTIQQYMLTPQYHHTSATRSRVVGARAADETPHMFKLPRIQSISLDPLSLGNMVRPPPRPDTRVKEVTSTSHLVCGACYRSVRPNR